MGNVSDKQVLKKYWEKSRQGMTASRDNREVKRCFDMYDKNQSGALEKEEALTYIKDILAISKLEEKIRSEAVAEGQDPDVYYGKVVDALFKEMDRNGNGTIEYEELVKPKVHLWDDFLRFVSMQTLHVMRTKLDEKPKKKKKVKKSELHMIPTRKTVKEGEEDDYTTSEEEDFVEAEDDDTKVEEKVAREIEKVGIANIKDLRSSHRAMDHNGIMHLRQSHVQSIVECLNVTHTQAQALLAAYAWDKEKVLELFIENPELVCQKAKIPFPLGSESSSGSATGGKGKNESSSTPTVPAEPPAEIECSICFCDSEDYTRLDGCGHAFCNDCWKGNLEMSIKEGHTFDIHCMHKGCPEYVPDFVVESLVSSETWTKYATFLAKAFVEGSRQIRWCPAPNCGKAIVEKIYEGPYTIGKCSCGNLFCFDCGDEAHTPVSCETLKIWKEKNAKDLSSIKWMMENTKPCPKCKVSIEKNDGCFMMTCRGCNTQFCWLCLGDWSTHSNHFECSKYKSKDLNNRPEWREGERPGGQIDGIPEEWVHYMDRFMQWSNSLDSTDKTWDALETKINQITADGVDPSFAIDAYRQLRESRRIIKFICVQICCDKDSNAKALSQLYLDSLEMVTEKLGKALGATALQPSQIRTFTKISRKAIHHMLAEEEKAVHSKK
jgi:hypothetical protein